ncbi:MAG: twin-arginine translocation signal domain-containing protein, partial [Planctomycetota bacterium]
MAMDLTPEQKEQGKSNFQNVSQDLSRRGFLKGLSAGAGVAAITPAVYFGYKSMEGNPVRAALIGCGDEGGILVGAHNPE